MNTAAPLQPAAALGSRKLFTSLQAGRALAALAVVLFHLGGIVADAKYFNVPWVAAPFRFGDAGVEFFFVLSGFIIASAHAADISRPARLIPYLQRRMIRIYPPYWIIFAIVCVMALPLAATRATLPTDPGTLTRAARDFASKRPEFAIDAGLTALHWMARGRVQKFPAVNCAR